jgi:hypothetical protein
MKTESYPSFEDIKERFPSKRLVKGFMGGAIFSAEKDGKFYVIEDESTMAGFLSPEDKDLFDMFVQVHEFDTEEERKQYLSSKGWL